MTQQDLPSGWTISRLADLLTVIRGVSYKKKDAHYEAGEGLIPIIRATNIERVLNFGSLVYVPRHYIKREQLLRAGDIVIAASSGSQSVVGKAAQLREEWLGSFGAFCLGLRPDKGTDDRYLAWFTQSEEYRNRVSTLSAGININNLRREHIEETPIPLPPLPEQRRIVAEIETQFTRLDASVAALRRAQANLRRYRASVLKDACEGRLVPAEAELARSDGREYEPAAALLERILAQRRARWESQEKRRGKYREPSAPDASALPQLPEGWVWATVEQIILGTPQNGLYKHKSEYGDGMPILRIDDYQDFYLRDRDSLQCLRVTPDELATYGLRQGQLVINRVNSPSHLGKCLVVPESLLPAVFESNMMRIAAGSGISVSYIAYYLRSFVGRTRLTSNAKWAVNQASINQTDVCSTPIPLPPLAEQRRIVAEVERRLSVVQQAEATVEASLARAERLRQSILKQAFSGRLVPQDPDDEPASALLERIRAEREAAAAAKGKSGRRGKRRGAQ